MTTKIKLSESNSMKLDYLVANLKIKRHVLCKVAVGYSLNIQEDVTHYKIGDNNGTEFNTYTIFGNLENLFKSLIIQNKNEQIIEEELYSLYLRNHLERGIEYIYNNYIKINSPTEYIRLLLKDLGH